MSLLVVLQSQQTRVPLTCHAFVTFSLCLGHGFLLCLVISSTFWLTTWFASLNLPVLSSKCPHLCLCFHSNLGYFVVVHLTFYCLLPLPLVSLPQETKLLEGRGYFISLDHQVPCTAAHAQCLLNDENENTLLCSNVSCCILFKYHISQLIVRR